jgi:hypothetical protein
MPFEINNFKEKFIWKCRFYPLGLPGKGDKVFFVDAQRCMVYCLLSISRQPDRNGFYTDKNAVKK